MILSGLSGKVGRFLSWFLGNRTGPVAELSDLPLVIIPAEGACRGIVVFYSGDGGWANLTTQVSATLSQAGYGIVGFDCMRYFWQERTPQEGARDLERALTHFQESWRAETIFALGYSMGADVLPGILLETSLATRQAISHTALLSLSPHVVYRFRFIGWLGYHSHPKTSVEILPQLEDLALERLLCLHGESEHHSLCATLSPNLARSQSLPGGHHYSGDYETVGKVILDHFNQGV